MINPLLDFLIPFSFEQSIIYTHSTVLKSYAISKMKNIYRSYYMTAFYYAEAYNNSTRAHVSKSFIFLISIYRLLQLIYQIAANCSSAWFRQL